MKNRLTFIVLAVAAAVIWTYIAVRLLVPRKVNASSVEIIMAAEPEPECELESLSESPFIVPKAERRQEVKQTEHKLERKTKARPAVQGRLVGTISASGSSLVVVKVNDRYHYLGDAESTEECRLLKVFANDSVMVLYQNDTLMLYKDEGRR